jgi:ubiquinone/menaquinone biosynthesis C-methylase UbiE
MPDKAPSLEMPKTEIRQRYNNFAPRYYREQAISNFLFGVKRMRRRLLPKRSGNILDVACGTGENFPFYRPDEDITAIDYSPGMLALAHEQATKFKLNIHFHEMDAEHLQFPDASFDTVISALSTCTFPDPIQALQEMARVCHPGGRILLLEHGRSSWGIAARYQDRNAHTHFQDVGCRWNQEPHDLVKGAGLKVLSHRRHVFGIFHVIEATP